MDPLIEKYHIIRDMLDCLRGAHNIRIDGDEVIILKKVEVIHERHNTPICIDIDTTKYLLYRTWIGIVKRQVGDISTTLINFDLDLATIEQKTLHLDLLYKYTMTLVRMNQI